MKKVLAFSAMIALFTGCTELNLPKPQTQANTNTSNNNDNKYVDCDKLYPPENDDKVKNNFLNRYECQTEYTIQHRKKQDEESNKIFGF